MDENDDHIAVVGIGCHFPGGEGIDNFWKVIVEGRNCTVEIPPERFDTKKWYDPDYNKPGKICTTQAALIVGLNEFDNKLFGISNPENENLDPQQKLLLECTYRALEDAGYSTESISGSKTGVFIGLMNRDWESIFTNYQDGINHFNGTGTSTSIAANRISYCFNLTGPSLAIDTACSSSLVALHYACQAIKQGDCEMAVCGGVSCILEPRVFVSLTKAKIICPDGISKPFSQNANGYGRGEGCGIVLLKKLKKAKEDYSKIWGVICASAVNQDGRSVTPITKPSQKQQEELLKSIYTTIDPSTVQYLEAHGTGTPVGDPVEVTSIGNIIGKRRKSGSPPLKIGSVKGNIGHTESAAGIAGLIKVLLMMHHEVIPPSLHYSKELGIKQLEKYNLSVPINSEKWENNGNFGRTAGINSFGFGGTNAHVVVRQHIQTCSQYLSKRPIDIFLLSAASHKSLKLTIKNTIEEISKVESFSLGNLVYTSACRRSHIKNKYRKAFLVSSLNDLQQKLASAKTETSPTQGSPQIVFVFCGNGVLYKGMCRRLLRSEPVFREKCIEIDELLQAYTPLSMTQLLENEADDFSKPDIAQPLLFTIQVSLVALLAYWGVKPDCVVGTSVGEVAAACCSGHLSLKDAVKVIYYRSTLQSKVTGGKMLVVGNIPVAEIAKDVEPYAGRINIAAYNSPTSCTVSGNAESMEKLSYQLNQTYSKRNIFLYELDLPTAYHSYMMDPILQEVKDKLQNLNTPKPGVDLISTVTGGKATDGDFTTGQYWARNIREPVVFEQALRASVQGKSKPLFIEIGPRRALKRNILEVLGEETMILPALHPEKDHETIFTILVKLFTEGYNPDWSNVYKTYKSLPAPLPCYQFDRIKQNMNFEKIRQGNQAVAASAHPLLHKVNEDLTEFTCSISTAATPFIYEHKNNRTVLVPGTFYVELGLAATISTLKPKVPLNSLSMNINFSTPCVVNQESLNLKIKLEQENKDTNFEIFSSRVYASGQIKKIREDSNEKRISLEHILKRCNSIYDQKTIYEVISKFGFHYGTMFKQLSDLHYGEELKEVIATVNVSGEIQETMYEYYIHPVILDCFFQTGVIARGDLKESEVLFPSQIGTLTVFRPFQKQMFIYVKTVQVTESYYIICGCFTDKNGYVLTEIRNAKMAFVRQTLSGVDNIFFHNKWIPFSGLEKKSIQTPSVILFADIAGIGLQLSKYIQNGLTYVMFNNWQLDHAQLKELNWGDKEIVFMWGVHRKGEDFPNNLTQYFAKCCEIYRQVIIAARKQNSAASIRTVTFRTVETTVDHINPGFALIGMTRSCAAEMPDITFQLIDIGSSKTEDVEALAQVIQSYEPKEHPEVWIKEGQIYTSEIARTKIDIEQQRQHQVPLKMSDNFALYIDNPYRITTLSAELENSKPTKLLDKNVEIQIDRICSHTEDFFPVSVSSWQFGDTLYWNALSVDKHKLLALDFTGTVTAVGKQTGKLKVGDQVAVCYPTTASSRASLPEDVCYSINDIPVLRYLPCISQFILAWEILCNQLQQPKNNLALIIKSSETHSILSKILANAAKNRGWEATVSRDIGINAKQSSAMIILPLSGNISEEDLIQLPLLKDVFVISDQKNSEGLQIPVQHDREDVHIHLLNPVAIFQKAYIKRNAKSLCKFLESVDANIFQDVQNTNFSGDTLCSYFTTQTLPIIELNKSISTNIPLFIKETSLFKRNAVYIVTGGLTGLGLETVKFIARHGGGHIVILSRRIPTVELQQEIETIKNQQMNTQITSVCCNVTNYSDVEKAMDSIQKYFPDIPVKGVFHSAVVLHDGILETLNLSLFEKVLGPKVDGALNLHYATIHKQLDYFVCYSSVSSFTGNAGQANYAAANSFLDVFCQYRRNMGLCGQSINWGALNLGVLLNQDKIHDILQARGILLFNTQEIHEYLEKCLQLNYSQQAIVKFDFKVLYDKMLSRIPALRKRLYKVVSEEIKSLKGRIQDKVSPKYTNIKSEDYVKLIISELAGVSVSDITMTCLLNSLGIDSMLAMTLQNCIFREKNVNIPMLKLLDPSTTVSTVVSFLNENANE
ncbi:uncharacterized protein LOC128496939 [Spea bombifrons]|uniref:uncharacterized protein LOC128496939 n=1 Tax=Spea bombifrons TaxID=233779 RepID=UPI002349556A|nr:uncharacterized protein LOC128496939 [Spea bombifrons]